LELSWLVVSQIRQNLDLVAPRISSILELVAGLAGPVKLVVGLSSRDAPKFRFRFQKPKFRSGFLDFGFGFGSKFRENQNNFALCIFNFQNSEKRKLKCAIENILKILIFVRNLGIN
jgi:hypothetical protein